MPVLGVPYGTKQIVNVEHKLTEMRETRRKRYAIFDASEETKNGSMPLLPLMERTRNTWTITAITTAAPTTTTATL